MSWFNLDPERLLIEQEAMAQKFPQFQMLRLEDDNLGWLGTLTTNRENSYTLLVEYPAAFPDKPPTVKPVEPDFLALDTEGKLKHQYPDGKLCLFYPGDRTFSRRTTAAAVIAVTAAWLFAYESWLETGAWPGKEIDHEEMMRHYDH